MAIGWGNLGAPPQPPCRASKAACRPRTAVARRSDGPSAGSVGRRDARSCSQGLEQACREVLLGADVRRDAGRGLLDLVAALRPGAGDGGQQLAERGHAVARLVGEVGAAVEGPAVRREEDAHGPAALPGQGLDGVHVDGVEVGALLAIDLDGHEVLVQVGRRGLVLERLALHDVAPVAGRVADGQEDRPVELARRARAPPRPRGTSPRGCGRAAAGTGSSRRPAGWRAAAVPQQVRGVAQSARVGSGAGGASGGSGRSGEVMAAAMVRGRRLDPRRHTQGPRCTKAREACCGDWTEQAPCPCLFP